RQKETWGSPTSGAAVQFLGSIHPGAWTRPLTALTATQGRVLTPDPGGPPCPPAPPGARAPRRARWGPLTRRLRLRDHRRGAVVRDGRREASRDVVLEDAFELLHQALAPERPVEPAVDEHRRDRLLERARQRDPDVGVLGLARPVHDAAHHRDPHVLDAGAGLLPLGHA